MQKEIKLFLSSTFDEKMQEQRDYFRKKIIPRLGQIVGQVGINLFLYDFELGIPQFDSKLKISQETYYTNVLDTCFQKIDDSDYFVGIVGDYYGTHINDGLKENYVGNFKELVDKGIRENLSVLELEFIKSLENKEQKKIFFVQNTISEGNIEIRKLITRITTTTATNVSVFYYSEYGNILTELEKFLKNEFRNEIYELSIEQKNRNLLYANKTRHYIDNTSALTIQNELDNYINNDSRKIFLLSGKVGSGKCTMLTRWMQKQKEKNVSNSEIKIISAFAGVDGNTISDILLNIYSQVPVNDKLSINQEEKDEKSLLNRFAKFTLEVSKQFPKTIIVIEGINQLIFTSDWKNKYWWLSMQLENNVKMIVSTTTSM